MYGCECPPREAREMVPFYILRIHMGNGMETSGRESLGTTIACALSFGHVHSFTPFTNLCPSMMAFIFRNEIPKLILDLYQRERNRAHQTHTR
jgi:hypothetical protein